MTQAGFCRVCPGLTAFLCNAGHDEAGASLEARGARDAGGRPGGGVRAAGGARRGAAGCIERCPGPCPGKAESGSMRALAP